MATRGSNKGGRRRQQGAPFLENGIRLLLMAGGLWLVTLFLADNPVLRPVASGLRTILWLPALIGCGLLGFHVLLKKASAPSTAKKEAPENPAARKLFTEFGEAVVKGPARQPAARPGPSPLRDVRFGHAPAAADEPHAHAPSSQVPADATTRAADAETVPYRLARWTPEVFAAIEWRRFEAVVETLFAQAGFETRSQSHGADGGVDIWLHSKNAEGPVSVVQCKHWQGKPVGVKEMREFFGVMASHGLKRGTYATTSRYTAEAIAFAKANGINAQDGDGLLKLISLRTPDQQARLLEVAYEGDYWKPTCASCGVKMTERTSGKDGNRFWGCVNYPRCKRTLAMKAT